MTEKKKTGSTARLTLSALSSTAGSLRSQRPGPKSFGLAAVGIGLAALLRKRLAARQAVLPDRLPESANDLAPDTAPTARSNAANGSGSIGAISDDSTNSNPANSTAANSTPVNSTSGSGAGGTHAETDELAPASVHVKADDAATAASPSASNRDQGAAMVESVEFSDRPTPVALPLHHSNEVLIPRVDGSITSIPTPVSASPVSGIGVSGSPVSGSPVSGSPVSGSPVPGSPVSGSPDMSAPEFAQLTSHVETAPVEAEQVEASQLGAWNEPHATSASGADRASAAAAAPSGGSVAVAKRPMDSYRFGMSPWSIFGMLGLSLFILAVILGSVIPLPYYRIEPGSVYNTIERVDVPGDLVFLPEGDISFVTVTQRANITPFQWLDAQLDESVLIRHEDEVLGDQTRDEQRERNQRRMQNSKDSAVVVALQRLGFDLIVTPLGIEVSQVFECSSADGLLGTGDLIVGVDGDEVLDGPALVAALGTRDVGDEVELLIDRIDPNNSAATLRTDIVMLTLGSIDDACLPDAVRAEEPRAFIGIGTSTLYDEQLPIDVGIETGRVGGPSAGLAFTLALMDVLSEGELTNGLNVVATGTIDRDGNVGPVGGIHQKTVAARRADADVFLVPMCCEAWADRITGEPVEQDSNFEEAQIYADGMLVIGVDNLDEALAAIGELGGDVERFIVTE